MTGIQEPGNIEQYVRDAWGDANSCMSPNDRAEAVLADVNVALQNEGIPAVGWIFNAAHGTGAVFAFREWQMELGEEPYSMDVADNATPEQQAWQISAVYHEARHAEQWFRMARLEAGRGKKADAIAKTMGIPRKIADEAAKSPLAADTPEGKEAETWYESVYGVKAAERNKILKDLPVLKQALLDANAEHDRVSKDAGASKDAKDAAQRKQAEAKRKFDEVYAKYLAMPEEADAWKVDAAVESAVKGP